MRRFSGELALTQKYLPVNGSVLPFEIVPWKSSRPVALAAVDGHVRRSRRRPGSRGTHAARGDAAFLCVCVWRPTFGAFDPDPDVCQALVTTSVTIADEGDRDQDDAGLEPAVSGAPAAPTSVAARASWSSPVAKRELNSST